MAADFHDRSRLSTPEYFNPGHPGSRRGGCAIAERKKWYYVGKHRVSAGSDCKRFRRTGRLIIALISMFTYLHPDSSVKQPVAFIGSLSLQFLVLAVLCRIPLPQMSGPSLRSNITRSSSITPIYFHRDAVAVPSAPEAAPSVSRPAPEAPREAKPETAQEVNPEAETTDDSSGKGEGQGLAPFSSWKMNSMAGGFAGMHHQIKNALPVFTPDPPILHGEVPEFARGKDVVVDVVIDDQGSIIQVGVLQGVGNGVENVIVETLRRWIFVPAKFNGMPVASRQQLRFHFPG